MSIFHRIIIPIVAFLVISVAGVPADAKKIGTRLKAPKPAKTENRFTGKLTSDPRSPEFAEVVDKLNFMGYDKKSSSDKETFFIDNGSDVAVKSIEVEISYFNEQGKLIHKRTVDVEGLFPAKETRKVDIASWDKQKSFHYTYSVPSKKGSTPYTVRFKILSIIKD